MSNLQFNLLPDVKMTYVKAARTRNLIVSISFLISAVFLVIFLLTLFIADVVQKKQLDSAASSVTKYTDQLKDIPNIDKIITVQNQLKTLVSLHKNKHISSRIFTYLPEVTPTKAHISDILLDFTKGTMEITGTADSHQTINTFIDTLKFTTYVIGNDSSAKTAFPAVLESSFSLDNTQSSASYTISATFDPVLFNNAAEGQTPTLIVPKLTTTRSVVEDPSNTLFNGSIKQPDTQKKQGSQQ